jgi:hypothetical protein
MSRKKPPKPKRKRKSPRDRGGELVRSNVVARVLGFDERTVRSYVETATWSGAIIKHKSGERRFYVHRSVFESLRDRSAADADVALG